MWARWCLGSIGGLAEVVRRGDSVGKRDMNDICGIRGLVERGGVLLRRWEMENWGRCCFRKELKNVFKTAGN